MVMNKYWFCSKMPPYFELKVEMYSYLMTDSTSSTHAKLVKTFSKAVGKAVAKTLKETDNQVGEPVGPCLNDLK